MIVLNESFLPALESGCKAHVGHTSGVRVLCIFLFCCLPCFGCEERVDEHRAEAGREDVRPGPGEVRWECVLGLYLWEMPDCDEELHFFDRDVCPFPEPYEGTGGWGEPLGEFKQTFYWKALEEESTDGLLVEIYDRRGRVIANVPLEFACELGLEGSGLLADGRIVNYWGSRERCVRTTLCRRPHYPSRNCYQVLDAEIYPWGLGVRRRALVPYLSIATDPHVIPFGTIVYLPGWDGYVLPDSTMHDGCFRSDDTGGAIIEDHIDVFTGLKSEWMELRRHFPGFVEVYIDPPRCREMIEWYDAVGAGCCEDDDCWYPGGVCLGESHFPGGYCSLETCRGGDCPDVGGRFAFCTDYFTGGTCVARCIEGGDCRQGYKCRNVRDLAGGTGLACIPDF